MVRIWTGMPATLRYSVVVLVAFRKAAGYDLDYAKIVFPSYLTILET
jgi:hypothetical protein